MKPEDKKLVAEALLEAAKQLEASSTVKMYHVTDPEAADSIEQEGFAGGFGDDGFGVYFFNNVEDAKAYAAVGGWDGSLKNPVILEAQVPLSRLRTVNVHPEWPDPEKYETIRWVPLDEDNEDDRLQVEVRRMSSSVSASADRHNKAQEQKHWLLNKGCIAWAKAYKDIFGGKLFDVVEPEPNNTWALYPGMPHHVVVKTKDGVFHDATGPYASEQDLLSFWEERRARAGDSGEKLVLEPHNGKRAKDQGLVARKSDYEDAYSELIERKSSASFDGGQEHMYFHVTPKSNLARILKTGLLPKIGARSKKLKEPNPAIYLFGSKEDAEEAVMNWLGDEFGDSALVLLSVSLPPDSVTKDGFEYRVYEAVDPSKVEVLGDL